MYVYYAHICIMYVHVLCMYVYFAYTCIMYVHELCMYMYYVCKRVYVRVFFIQRNNREERNPCIIEKKDHLKTQRDTRASSRTCFRSTDSGGNRTKHTSTEKAAECGGTHL